MAIYHLSSKIIGRSKGHSAVAAAAYRSGEKLEHEQERFEALVQLNDLKRAASNRDEYKAELERKVGIYDYTRKTGVMHSEILIPELKGAKTGWMQDRQSLWNQVEQSEKRKDSQLAREVEAALPRELNLEQQKKLVQGYVKEAFTAKGLIADIAIHHSPAKDGDLHPHVHCLLTMRHLEVDERGNVAFGKKIRKDIWRISDKTLEDQKDTEKEKLIQKSTLNELQIWREAWAEHVNKALEDAGQTIRVDHRTLEDQGVKDRKPQVRLGKAIEVLEEQGIATTRGNKHAYVTQKNAALAKQQLLKQAIEDKLQDPAQRAQLMQEREEQGKVKQQHDKGIKHER